MAGQAKERQKGGQGGVLLSVNLPEATKETRGAIAAEADDLLAVIREQVEREKAQRVSDARQGEVRQKIAEPQKPDDQKTAAKAAELFNTNRTYLNQAVKFADSCRQGFLSQPNNFSLAIR